MDIWAEQARIGRALMGWSIGSIAAGGVAALVGTAAGAGALQRARGLVGPTQRRSVVSGARSLLGPVAATGAGARALALLDPGQGTAARALEVVDRWAAGTPAGRAVSLLDRRRGRPAPAQPSVALQAFGVQNAVWGAIDLAIAVGGAARRKRHMAQLEDPADPQVQAAERASLRRALLASTGLDVAFIAGGAAGIAWSLRGRVPGQPLPAATGHAAGVVVQATFLLGLDSWHAARLRQR